MTHLIRLASACALAVVSLTAGAQQAQAKEVCKTTWGPDADDDNKVCRNSSGKIFGDIDIHPTDDADPDADQRLALQTIDYNRICGDDLSCHFSWSGRDYDVSEDEGVRIIFERFIPTITITCTCTLD